MFLSILDIKNHNIYIFFFFNQMYKFIYLTLGQTNYDTS